MTTDEKTRYQRARRVAERNGLRVTKLVGSGMQLLDCDGEPVLGDAEILTAEEIIAFLDGDWWMNPNVCFIEERIAEIEAKRAGQQA